MSFSGYDKWKTRSPDDELHHRWRYREKRRGCDIVTDPVHNVVEIVTHYWAKPIPARQFDWEALYDDDDGAPEIGYGATEADAVRDLIDSYSRPIKRPRS
jgi:hypothetical protein